MESFNKKIFILGPTGIGKTFLSLLIAEKCNGEIINTDAFSLYREANIMTAKATKEEQEKVAHHMIDVLSLFDVKYTVVTYMKAAAEEVLKVEKKGKNAIIVGGTNYYVDSLMFKKENKEANENKDKIEFKESDIKEKETVEDIKKIKEKNNNDKNELYLLIEKYLNDISEKNKEHIVRILEVVDTEYYKFYHKNDTRRIINAIAYYFTYDIKKSSIEINKECTLYYPHTKIIMLLPTDMSSLSLRISNRVDSLLEDGLAEIIYVFASFSHNNIPINFTVGVLQAIGYKEFYPLFEKLPKEMIENVYKNYTAEKSNELSQSVMIYVKQSFALLELFNQCKEELKKNTVNYAKYQIKWIKKKIVEIVDDYCVINVEKFDKETFTKDYFPKAFEYIKSTSYVSMKQSKVNKMINWKRYHCDICNVDMNGDKEYENHMKSNSHKKRKLKHNKQIKEQKV